jgi:hypothetical protein
VLVHDHRNFGTNGGDIVPWRQPPRRQAVVSGDFSVPAAQRFPKAIEFYPQRIPEGLRKNEVTGRSTRAERIDEPGISVSRVSPTPLLVGVRAHASGCLTRMA